MKGVTQFDKCYDRAFFYMWDFTTGQATNWRECYRGAKHFGRFLLSELDRKSDFKKKNEIALARRGLVASESILRAWVFNVVEDCSELRAPLPPEMLEVIYRVMGCSHHERAEDGKFLGVRRRFEARRKSEPDLPIRATARDLGVDPATIVRWKREPPGDPDDFDHEVYKTILERTKVSEFADRGSKALRR